MDGVDLVPALSKLIAALQLFILIICPCVLYLEGGNLKKTLKNFLVRASVPEADQLCLNLL